MCLIIDTNTFNSVFDKNNIHHDHFAPILNWIIEGEGKVIIGGTKYKNELKHAHKYLKIFGQLNRSRKLINLNDQIVDDYQKILEAMETHPDFDDPHLVAIAYTSRCKIICSLDKRAFPFLNRKDFYPNNSPRPKIYSSNKNINLLCRKYIANICEPCLKLNKNEISVLKTQSIV